MSEGNERIDEVNERFMEKENIFLNDQITVGEKSFEWNDVA